MTVDDFLIEWRDHSKSYIEAYTSGSTGRPKLIRLPKPFVRASAQRTINYFNIRKGDRLHLCLSPDYIAGKMMIVRCELAGARLSWEIPSNHPLSDLSDCVPIKLMSVVPSQMDWLLENIASIPTVEHFLIGGAAVTESMVKRIVNAGINATESYGMTETASHVALRSLNGKEDYFSMLEGGECFLNDKGCLAVKIGEQEWHTNDLALINGKKQFKILGRFDNVINSGGVKIFPEQLEQTIAEILANENIGGQFMICSRESERWGREAVMAMEGNAIDCNRIIKLLSKSLNHIYLPKAFYVVEKLPRTPTGKVIRQFSALSL